MRSARFPILIILLLVMSHLQAQIKPVRNWGLFGQYMHMMTGSAIVSANGGTPSKDSAGNYSFFAVNSVGLSMPAGFSVANSPVTSSATLAVTTTLNGIIKGNGSGFTAVSTLGNSDISALAFSKLTGLPTTLSGYGITDAASSTHNHTLNSLSNVNVTGLVNGQALKWNSTTSKWELYTPAVGTVTSVSLAVPTGFSVSGSPISSSGTLTIATTLNGIIKGNGSGFTASSTIGNADIADLAFSKLTGNPTTLSGYGITDAATSTHNHTLNTLSNVNVTGLANGQSLKWNSTSSQWEVYTPAAGSVTSVGLTMPTGFTVSNSPVSSTGNLTVTTTLNGILKGNGSGFTAVSTIGNADITDLAFSKLTGKPTTLSGYGITDAATATHNHTLNSLSNVNVTGLANGDLLKYNSTTSNWEKFTPNYLTAASAWSLAGNTSTNPATQFLGTTDAQPVVFKTNNTERMRLLSNGNLLLGLTTDAGHKLDVNGSIRTLGDLYLNSNSRIFLGSEVYFNNAGGTNLFIGPSAGGSVINTANYNIALGTNALSSLTDGVFNAGIGPLAGGSISNGSSNSLFGSFTGYDITTGSYNSIVGSESLDQGIPSVTGNYNSVLGALVQGITTGSYNTILGANVSMSNESNTVVLADGQGNKRVYIPATGNVLIGNTTTDDGDNKLQVEGSASFREDGTEQAYINKNGNSYFNTNVGIGTQDFSDPDYKLFVEGYIRARKVRVDNDNLPDYVFHDGYHLPTLAEVQQYINEHKHLPGMPSAEEVKKDGLDLSENQSLLLKKIEELTLYVIDLNKKVEKLEAENQELKKQKQ